MTIGGVGLVHIVLNRGRDLRDVDTTAVALGYNRRTGLDDRGLTYLRYGAPKSTMIGPPNTIDDFCRVRDLERWQYDNIGTVRFFKPGIVTIIGAASSQRNTGDMVIRPMNREQFAATVASLTADETALPAPLEFGSWTAQFQAPDDKTEVVVVTTRGAAAAMLVSPTSDSTALARDSGGVPALQVRPGDYTALVNALDHDTLGRQSLRLRVRSLRTGLSDLLLAHAWPDRDVTREAMLGHLSRALVFRAGSVLRVYAEIYGLPAVDDRIRYRATYTVRRTEHPEADLAREDLPGAVALSYLRDVPAAPAVAEWLDISPEQLPAGSYLLRLDITEEATGRRVGRSQITFTMRSIN